MTKAGKLLLDLGTLAPLAVFALIGQSCTPSLIYSCTGPHCYGRVEIHNPNVISLFRLTLDTPQLVGGDDHITDELWLLQDQNPACSANPYAPQVCWVEVGLCAGQCFDYAAEGPQDPTLTKYFWAEAHPNGNYIAYDLAIVPQEQFGQPMSVQIVKLPDSDQPNSFFASLEPGLLYGGVSTNNTMTPTIVQFGLELSGTIGALATDAHFTNLYLVDSSGGAYLWDEGKDFWNGITRYDPPIVASWEIFPNQSSSGGRISS
jgi:hypothetical protein